MNGNIVLHRKILEWEWYTNINTKVLFIHLLLKANWKDAEWQGNVIKRGQLVTSIPALSEQTALTPKEVRTALDHLISTGEIGRQKTNKYSVITVLNYDEYQNTGRQTADKGQSNGSLRATNELNNKNNNINNNISPSEPGESEKSKEEILWHNYELIYKAYPKTGDKQEGYKHYRGYIGKGRVVNGKRWRLTNEQMYKAVKKYAAEKEGVEDRYIKGFASFMNQKIIDYVEVEHDTS